MIDDASFARSARLTVVVVVASLAFFAAGNAWSGGYKSLISRTAAPATNSKLSVELPKSKSRAVGRTMRDGISFYIRDFKKSVVIVSTQLGLIADKICNACVSPY